MFTQHPVWNKELLFVGGFLARAVYELEMQDIGACWDVSIASTPGEPLDSGLQKRLYNKAGHNLRFFTFRESTPSPIVSNEIRSAFFNCGVQGQPFPVISSAGVRSALDVRVPNPVLSAFPKKLPVFPEELLDSSGLMVSTLQERGMLKDIMFQDVLDELQERTLSEEETVACLQWWINMSPQEPVEINDIRQRLLDAMHVTINSSGDGDGWIISVKEIQTFLHPQNDVLPTDGPLPSHLLPISISQKFDPVQLQKSFQWRELTVLDWAWHIVDPMVYIQRIEFNIVESPFWAERVLQVLSKCWPTLSRDEKTDVNGLFSTITCIPTSAGMKKPRQAYFSNASIFDNLPVVNLPSGVQIKLKEVLDDLGVWKYVEPKVVYNQ